MALDGGMMRILRHYHGLGRLALLIGAPLLLARSGLAQRVDPQWPRPPLGARLAAPSATGHDYPPATRADSAVIPATYWLEGAAVVGGLGAIAGGVLGVGACGYDGPCHNPGLKALYGAAVLGVVAFGLGALIGGQFPKH